MVGDSLVAALLGIIDLLLFVGRQAGDPAFAPPAWYVTAPLMIGAVVPLAFRRRYPIVVAYVVLAVSIPHSWFEIGFAGLVGFGIALYTLVAYVNRRHALLYVVANVVVSAVQLPMQLDGTAAMVAGVVTGVGVTAFCWVLGEFVGARRAYQAEVEARLHLLETERDQQATIAVAAERARIARELHDVVAHAVSVIVVQADGAAYAVRSQPELTERAIKTISATGREALTELRRLLGVLRSERADEERTPQPGTRSLAELAERFRAVGLPVRLEVVGAIDDLPAGVGLGIYRIVQEALTNCLKHAGPGASAVVRVERRADKVELTVLDDGVTGSRALVGVSGGNGLIGMRERAHVFGGTLQAGPHPGGGWRVRAVLPVGSG
ncbi:MAG TPA: sensor histidine kinase [Actinophytocola sp.]|nr:sensor histidine kinase [Actinophytocola sp.]HEV2779052.1 sensor histidine kinase [Actinophytocola sp.]